jgi:hypothetical protein
VTVVPMPARLRRALVLILIVAILLIGAVARTAQGTTATATRRATIKLPIKSVARAIRQSDRWPPQRRLSIWGR